LAAVEAELTEVKRVSAAALELDSQNRTLTTELENLRADAELLRLENVRLQERISNAQIIDGALAVLLGVAITVVVPRLVPRRRRNDGWS
jgi:SH3 domain protein